MYDDDIGFFVVCFQIFSLETEIVVPVLVFSL